MTSIRIDPTMDWDRSGASIVRSGQLLLGVRAFRRRSRRRSLLARLERIAFERGTPGAGTGRHGWLHPYRPLAADPRGVLVLDTRRVAGLIFGGDQMSEWTVMGRGHRYTFDNPQPALYDRIAAVKAIVGDVPVEGRLLFSNVGKFTKGIPKWVLMLDGIEVEFPALDRGTKQSAAHNPYTESWGRLVAQLRPSPHLFTNL